MEFKRYENETDDELIYRVCSQKDMIGGWQDVADVLNDLLDQTYGESKYRKAYQSFEKMLDANRDKFIGYEEQLKELEDLKDELYKERVRLQDIQREKRNVLRGEARYENLIEVFKDNLLNTSIEIKDYKQKDSLKKKKYAVLCFSDWHCGLKVDNQFNYYDIETMTDRAMTIRDKAIKYCQMHNVTNLVVELNGDMVDGLIHTSSRVEQEEGVINQVVVVTDIIAKLVNSMKPYFEEIKIVTTLGNHGRLTPNKHDSVTKENFEMLIPIMLRDKLKDVKVIDPKGLDFVKYEIDGKTIIVSHGQNDRLASVIANFTNLFKEVPNEIHLGHTHGYKDINDCNVIVSVNGSLVGSDEYSLTLRKVTAPSQNLIIYEDDRCLYELKAE